MIPSSTDMVRQNKDNFHLPVIVLLESCRQRQYVREILKSRLTRERPGCLMQKHLLELGQGEWRLISVESGGKCSMSSIP